MRAVAFLPEIKDDFQVVFFTIIMTRTSFSHARVGFNAKQSYFPRLGTNRCAAPVTRIKPEPILTDVQAVFFSIIIIPYAYVYLKFKNDILEKIHLTVRSILTFFRKYRHEQFPKRVMINCRWRTIRYNSRIFVISKSRDPFVQTIRFFIGRKFWKNLHSLRPADPFLHRPNGSIDLHFNKNVMNFFLFFFYFGRKKLFYILVFFFFCSLS